jgi:hypothetical protein
MHEEIRASQPKRYAAVTFRAGLYIRRAWVGRYRSLMNALDRFLMTLVALAAMTAIAEPLLL